MRWPLGVLMVGLVSHGCETTTLVEDGGVPEEGDIGTGGGGGAGGAVVRVDAGEGEGEVGDLQGRLTLTEKHRGGDDPFIIEIEIAGEFVEFASPASPPAPGRMAGDCEEVVVANAGDPGDFRALSVGEITVSGASGALMDISIPFDGVARAYSIDVLSAGIFDLWEVGDALTISAPGTGDFGAFEIGADAPTDFVDVAPNADAGFSRQGTMVTWVPGNGGAVIVEVAVSGSPSRIRCPTGDVGGVMVPGEAFGWLPADAENATLIVTRIVSTAIASGPPSGRVEVGLHRVHVGRRIGLAE